MPENKSANGLKLLDLLQKVSIIANEAQTVEDVIRTSLNEICASSGWQLGHYFYFDEEKNTFSSSKLWSVREEGEYQLFRAQTESISPLPDHTNWIGYVYETAEPNWTTNLEHEEGFLRAETAAPSGLKSAAAFPVFDGRKVVGVMEFLSAEDVPLDEDFLNVMRTIGNFLGYSVEKTNYERSLKRANLRAEAAAQDMRESLEKAEAANKAKSSFLANMSHELRTPMNGILGLCEMLLETQLTDEQRDNAEIIRRSGQNLLSILNDILDISKIEAGELELESVPFDLKIAIDEMLKLFRPVAEQKGLAMYVEGVDTIPHLLRGDVTKVQQVLRNLINNALKFTEKGSITLVLKILAVNDEEFIYLGVRDTGIGIPESKQQAIFEKFAQADASVTRKFGGTGLGLAICQYLAGLLGGDIGVKSEEGKGSEFWFSIPVVSADGEQPVNAFQGQGHAVSGHLDTNIRILAAEDHPVNRIFIEKVFQKLGLQNFDIVEDGLQAIQKVENSEYDLILMDCQMPEIDGYEATRILRVMEGEKKLGRTPVVALTANAMVGDREKCLKAGMDDYLSKPIKAENLREVIKQWAGRFCEIPFVEQNSNAKNVPYLTDHAVVNMDHLAMFTEGNKTIEEELYEIFIFHADESVKALEVALDQGNPIWKAVTHKLKGSAANMGAERLAALCLEAEKKENSTFEEKQKAAEAVRKGLEEVRAFFEDRLR